MTVVDDYIAVNVDTPNCLRPTLRPTVQKRKLVHLHCSIRAGSEMGQEGVFVLRSKRAEPDPTESAAHKFCGKIRSDFSNCDIIISGKNLYVVGCVPAMNLIQTLRFTRLHRVFMTVFQFLRLIVCGRALRSDCSKREFVNLHCKIRAGSKMGQEGVFVLRS